MKESSDLERRGMLSLRTLIAGIFLIAILYVAVALAVVGTRVSAEATRVTISTEATGMELERLAAAGRQLEGLVVQLSSIQPGDVSAARTLADALGRAELELIRVPTLGTARAAPDVAAAVARAIDQESRVVVRIREATAHFELGRDELAQQAVQTVFQEQRRFGTLVSEAQLTAFQTLAAEGGAVSGVVDEMGRALIVWIGLGTLLAALALVVLRARVAKPLASLDQAMGRVSAGSLDVSLPVLRRDEIGLLSEHFNKMVGILRSLMDEESEARGRAEEQLEESERRLRQAQKMEAVGQLTGGVAHDFNNLLTVIGGNLELVRPDLVDRPEVLELLDFAVEATSRGATLTKGLLAFSRKQPLRPTAVDLQKSIAAITDVLGRTLGEDVEIETSGGAGLWRCEADPTQVEAAILNLAINARDAMPRGGRLTIETANARVDDSFSETHDIPPGQYVSLSVTDTGVGMDADTVERVFEPFYTTKEPGQGSGLGLSMVYGFVRQSGGVVRIYSEVGEGTTVRMYFPRARTGDHLQEVETPRSSEDLRGNGEVILVVEDEDAVRRLACLTLERLGYGVIAAEHGPAAIAVLNSEQRVDLLFTDIVLPAGMSGVQLAKEAKRLRPGLEVIYTSGYTENAVIHHGRLDPGVDLLEKPYNRDQLGRAMKRGLARSASGHASGNA